LRVGELVTVASSGIAEPDSLANSELVQRSYRTLDMVKVDLPSDIRLDGGLVQFRPRTIVALPLHTRLVPIGVVVLASTAPIDDRQDLLIQQLLSNFALGVVLFDIDHFKSVNDTYGHQVGDDVLKSIAQNVKDVLREGDTLMRYGGEEFLVVLPGAGDADLRTLGERMRRIVEPSVIFDSGAEVRVTISLGGISFPSTDAANLDDLIRKADAAMYNAKKTGRNRLTLVDA